MSRIDVRDGRPVLVRTGDGSAAEALRTEARLLTTMAGAGVPDVLELDDSGDTVGLVTALAPPLVLRGLPPPQLAGVLADVADVLARARGHGITHGPLRVEHVRGRPGAIVVSGWDRATTTGDATGDVVELGALLEQLAPTDGRLRAIVARTTAAEPPTMAAVAAALREHATSERPRRSPRPALGWVAAAITAVVLITAGSALTRNHRSDPRTDAPPPLAPRATTSTTTRPPWQDERVRVEGNVLERAGDRWTIGAPGDVVVVGDWDCDGVGTPAVLRPSTGTAWTFVRWPDGGDRLAGEPVARVDGAVGARVVAAGRCDRLEVVDAQGRSTVIS